MIRIRDRCRFGGGVMVLMLRGQLLGMPWGIVDVDPSSGCDWVNNGSISTGSSERVMVVSGLGDAVHAGSGRHTCVSPTH